MAAYGSQYRGFVSRVRRELREFDWSVPDLARQAGVSTSTVYRLMRGRVRYVRWSTVLAIGSAVGLDVTVRDETDG